MQAYENRPYWTRLHASNPGRLSAVGYAGLGEGFNRASYRLRRRAVWRLLGRNGRAEAPSLLEAAAGVGAYAQTWARLAVSRWTGLDISAEAVDHCRREFPWGRFFQQDIASTGWPEEAGPGRSFDLVTAIDVLYHLVEDGAFEAAVANLAGRVRPGGLLLVSDVFVPHDRQIAAHVKRRSLASYHRALGPEMELIDREPVFSILADAVPRSAAHVPDHALLAAWRALAKTLVSAPRPLRNALGAAAVAAAWPLDGLLRRAGLARGVNLELALFRRT